MPQRPENLHLLSQANANFGAQIAQLLGSVGLPGVARNMVDFQDCGSSFKPVEALVFGVHGPFKVRPVDMLPKV